MTTASAPNVRQRFRHAAVSTYTLLKAQRLSSQYIFVEHLWIITAACCAIVALIFLVMGRFDAAFVSGALGILAWFLDVRSRLKKDAGLEENKSAADADNSGVKDED